MPSDVKGKASPTRRRVVGWSLSGVERGALLARFPPRYGRVVADHVTLRSGVADDLAPPPAARGRVIGMADDGEGVQALVLEIDGASDRPGGGTYHITWSLGPGRQARESNAVIAAGDWRPVAGGPELALQPARFFV